MGRMEGPWAAHGTGVSRLIGTTAHPFHNVRLCRPLVLVRICVNNAMSTYRRLASWGCSTRTHLELLETLDEGGRAVE